MLWNPCSPGGEKAILMADHGQCSCLLGGDRPSPHRLVSPGPQGSHQKNDCPCRGRHDRQGFTVACRPDSLACAAGLDEEGQHRRPIPCKPEAQARDTQALRKSLTRRAVVARRRGRSMEPLKTRQRGGVRRGRLRGRCQKSPPSLPRLSRTRLARRRHGRARSPARWRPPRLSPR